MRHIRRNITITLGDRVQVLKGISLWYTGLSNTYNYIILMNLFAEIGKKVLNFGTVQTQFVYLQQCMLLL